MSCSSSGYKITRNVSVVIWLPEHLLRSCWCFPQSLDNICWVSLLLPLIVNLQAVNWDVLENGSNTRDLLTDQNTSFSFTMYNNAPDVTNASPLYFSFHFSDVQYYSVMRKHATLFKNVTFALFLYKDSTIFVKSSLPSSFINNSDFELWKKNNNPHTFLHFIARL